MKTLISITGLLTAGAALAHPGHGLAESVHGLLHGEHILLAAAAAVLVYLLIRNSKV